MLAEKPGDIEGDDEEGQNTLENMKNVVFFARYYNSIVGLGADRTLKALSLGGHGLASMRRDVTRMISECSICQN